MILNHYNKIFLLLHDYKSLQQSFKKKRELEILGLHTNYTHGNNSSFRVILLSLYGGGNLM
jgi:hypothetical protein